MKRHMIIPIFVPHMGCPFDCVFCNQKKISGHHDSMDEAAVHHQISAYLSSSQGIDHIEIAFYGGSFTGIDPSLQKRYLDIAKDYVIQNNLTGIRMSTRPDMINEVVLDRLKAYPITAIELGVQSMHDDVLTASTRGHNVDDVYRASKLIRTYGFSLGLQMMLGLPKDTIAKSLSTADHIIAIEPDMVRIYPTLVIKNTPLATLYNQGEYIPFTLDETIDLCVSLLERFDAAGIDVLRIGLQNTDQIQPGKDVIAGPYHPALRQLVEEKRWVNYIMRYINTAYRKGTDKPIVIESPLRLYQTLVGHKKAHLAIYEHHQPLIIVKQNNSLPSHTIKIDDTYHKAHAQIH